MSDPPDRAGSLCAGLPSDRCCEALTWNALSSACFFKAQSGELIPFMGAQSGIRVETDWAVTA